MLNKQKFEYIFFTQIVRGTKEEARRIVSKTFPGHKIFVDNNGYAKVTYKDNIVALYGSYRNEGPVLIFMD